MYKMVAGILLSLGLLVAASLNIADSHLMQPVSDPTDSSTTVTTHTITPDDILDGPVESAHS